MLKKPLSKNKNSVENKLKAYSALAAGVIALAGNADAQILYTDINPDTIIGQNSSYLLDLNKDGTPDFRFSQTYKVNVNSGSTIPYNTVEITPLNSGNRALNTSSEDPYPVALPLNASIGPDAAFWDNYSNRARILNASYDVKGTFNYLGKWLGVIDKYIGMYIQLDGKKYYAWARLDIAKNPESFTIKDFALNTVADEKILAGDKGLVGIMNQELNINTLIYTNNKDLYINFKNSEKINGKIDLYNTSGQLMNSLTISENENHFIMENVSSGIYILKIQTNKGILSKKIRIE